MKKYRIDIQAGSMSNRSWETVFFTGTESKLEKQLKKIRLRYKKNRKRPTFSVSEEISEKRKRELNRIPMTELAIGMQTGEITGPERAYILGL